MIVFELLRLTSSRDDVFLWMRQAIKTSDKLLKDKFFPLPDVILVRIFFCGIKNRLNKINALNS